MLTLTFLGVGAAFAKRNHHSNALLESWANGPDRQSAPDATLLIDFGGTGPLALYELSRKSGFEYLQRRGALNYPAVRSVFISHLHSDHIGGLEELAIMNLRSDPGQVTKYRPKLLGGFDVLPRLWEHSLQGGLGTLDGRSMSLADYFEVTPLDVSGLAGASRWTLANHYEIEPFRTDHIRLARSLDWPSYGLNIRDVRSGHTVFYSGDTRFDPRLTPMMALAQTCFHDAQLVAEDNCVHASLDELRTLPAEIRAKTYLYHLADSWDDPAFAFVAKEFAGFARPHQRTRLFD